MLHIKLCGIAVYCVFLELLTEGSTLPPFFHCKHLRRAVQAWREAIPKS